MLTVNKYCLTLWITVSIILIPLAMAPEGYGLYVVWAVASLGIFAQWAILKTLINRWKL